jgi:hypothetical protein
LALAFPPFAAPNLLKATAAGFRVSGSGSGNGDPSRRSPMASSTTRRAMDVKSLVAGFGFSACLLGKACADCRTASLYFSAARAYPDFKLTHYRPLAHLDAVSFRGWSASTQMRVRSGSHGPRHRDRHRPPLPHLRPDLRPPLVIDSLFSLTSRL